MEDIRVAKFDQREGHQQATEPLQYNPAITSISFLAASSHNRKIKSFHSENIIIKPSSTTTIRINKMQFKCISILLASAAISQVAAAPVPASEDANSIQAREAAALPEAVSNPEWHEPPPPGKIKAREENGLINLNLGGGPLLTIGDNNPPYYYPSGVNGRYVLWNGQWVWVAGNNVYRYGPCNGLLNGLGCAVGGLINGILKK